MYKPTCKHCNMQFIDLEHAIIFHNAYYHSECLDKIIPNTESALSIQYPYLTPYIIEHLGLMELSKFELPDVYICVYNEEISEYMTGAYILLDVCTDIDALANRIDYVGDPSIIGVYKNKTRVYPRLIKKLSIVFDEVK